MDQAYWILEYAKVLLVYLFVMYLWPSVVFRTHLAGKSRAYRFCFCVNGSVILINTSVLLLGLLHLLHWIPVTVLYLGVFLVQLWRNYHLGFSWFRDLRSLAGKTLSFRRMLLKWRTAVSRRLGAAGKRAWQASRGRRLETVLLGILVLFAMLYFSINALQVHSYGFGDQYVHHAWVYEMGRGKLFPAGIYPAGMHAFLYLMNAVFHVSVYSCNLFLAGIHVSAYILSVYFLSRALFGWRMSGLLAITGFLTVEQVVVNGVFGISRLSWTLPQEFALYTVFLAACGLLGFLRSLPKKGEKTGPRPSFWRSCIADGNLFILVSSLAASVCVHFYATIIAAFVCLVITCVHLPRLFRPGAFLRLAAGVLAAFVIGVFPMAVAYAAGYPLQGSLFWAMSVTRESMETAEKEPGAEAVQTESAAERPALSQRAGKVLRGTFYELYGKKRGRLLLITDVAVGAGAVLALAAQGIAARKAKDEKKKRFPRAALRGYLVVAVSVFVLMMAYRPGLIGLPSLIAGTRVCSTVDLLSMLLFACVPDALFTLAGLGVKDRWLKPLSAAVCIGIYLAAQATGVFHGYLYYELTRYPAAVELTKEIVRHLPRYQYTIVSTTDELYQVRETGFHEEWIDFVEKSSDRTYTIPTPYLFFFIEKRPIRYAQNSFASGPSWLARDKYDRFYGSTGARYPEILHGEISREAAQESVRYGKKRSETETKLSNRIIVESRAYAWFEKFSALHPNDGEVVYEDEDLLCYCVHQNPYSLFSLGVMD